MTRSAQIETWANLLKVLWGAGLFFGGLIFVFYFLLIGFMPEMDLSGSVTLLVVAALTGVLLLVLLLLLLVAPGWHWQSVTGSNERLKSPWWFGLPTLGVLLGWFLVLWQRLRFPNGAFLIWAFSVGLPVVLLSRHFIVDKLQQLLSWVRRGQHAEANRVSKNAPAQQHVLLTTWDFFLGVLYSFWFFGMALLFVLGRTIQSPSPSKHPVLVAILAMMTVWLGNLFLAWRKSSISGTLFVGGMVIFLLFSYLSSWTLIPRLVMYEYKFGNFRASLLLDEIGCTIVEQHRFTAPPGSETCSVPDVIIRSRLGKAYFVELSQHGDSPAKIERAQSQEVTGPCRAAPCFTIPEQHVLSWAANESPATSTKPAH